MKSISLVSICFFAIILVLISSCDGGNKAIPFPSEEKEFEIPKSTKLQFSEPKKFDWKVSVSQELKSAPVRKVNFEKLPSKPFYPDGFLPLLSTPSEVKFDFIQLPDTVIDFKNLETKPLKFQTSLIEPPKIVKTGLPKLKRNASLGVFEFGEDQGFPGYLVTSMMQDSKGMIWIATDKGLCRFNGEYLEIYSFIDEIFTGALASVNDMAEDKKGRIWIYTAQNGIYVLDHAIGVVREVKLSLGAFNFNAGCDMLIDSKGFIWLGTRRDGLFIIDPEKETFRQVSKLKEGDKGDARQLAEDAEGNIWTGSQVGLSVINQETGRVRFLDNTNGLPSNQVLDLYMDTKNQIWTSTLGAGISIIQPKQGSILNEGSQTGIIHDVFQIIQDNDQKMWMATNSGVYILDVSKNTFKYLNASKGLNDDVVINLMNDKQGQIWIATNQGLNLIDTEGIMPNYLTEVDGLSGPDVWSFFEDRQDRIWIGSRQGIDVYYPEKNIVKKVNLELQLGKGSGIAFNFHKLNNGNYLILAASLGFGIFDPERETITTVTKEQGLTNTFPNCSMVDNQGRLWTGSFRNQGIEIIDLEKGTFTLLTNADGLIGDIVWGINQDRRGMIWVSTDKGINIINPEENTISYLIENGKISERNGSGSINDKDGRVWITTRSGILIADPEQGLLTSISTENGLINPAVYTLYEHQERIYAGTGNGLTVFIPKPKNNETSTSDWNYDLKSYGKQQGFIYTDFNAGSAFSYLNKLWFGIEGQAMTVIDIPKEERVQNTTLISGISISDQLLNFYTNRSIQKKYPSLDTLFTAKKDTFFMTDNLPEETGWLMENNIQWDSASGYFNLPVNLKIPYEQNYVSFQFTGNQSTNRDMVRYRYVLEGFDKEWSEISDKPFSENYRNLPAGKYTFKVRSRGFDGDWSEPAQFTFTVLPHWTNTWWAWLLYLIGFVTVVGIIVQYRSKMLKRENLILEEKVKHRTFQLNRSIEDLKSTQSQLIQSEKMASLGELTAGIAHEIQNPLNFVNNFSEVSNELIAEIEEERAKNQEARDETLVSEILQDVKSNLEKINHHGKRADAIVKGMLEHSRAGKGEKAPTDINALADEYLRLAYHGLRAKDKSFTADFSIDLDPNLPKVNVVASDLGRVLLNLINNAFYACAERSRSTVNERSKKAEAGYAPKVLVSSRQENGKVLISVQDNGNGIPQKILDKIFQPFFTTKPTGQGTGLGLSLSYDIVKAHGGELKVETNSGEGLSAGKTFTEFTIILPL
ncbi:sensor histidine kinase [Cognataquiflexum aquatile]|uniref:sensor histidine kinase n=1 Tax=Cognataquiflexum aquatile TaxID=2249427 RepID=UPI0018E59E86|nr:two-component regulator propeller domain-containing protein [Cognataquiflexum aquatile]